MSSIMRSFKGISWVPFLWNESGGEKFAAPGFILPAAGPEERFGECECGFAKIRQRHLHRRIDAGAPDSDDLIVFQSLQRAGPSTGARRTSISPLRLPHSSQAREASPLRAQANTLRLHVSGRNTCRSAMPLGRRALQEFIDFMQLPLRLKSRAYSDCMPAGRLVRLTSIR